MNIDEDAVRRHSFIAAEAYHYKANDCSAEECVGLHACRKVRWIDFAAIEAAVQAIYEDSAEQDRLRRMVMEKTALSDDWLPWAR